MAAGGAAWCCCRGFSGPRCCCDAIWDEVLRPCCALWCGGTRPGLECFSERERALDEETGDCGGGSSGGCEPGSVTSLVATGKGKTECTTQKKHMQNDDRCKLTPTDEDRELTRKNAPILRAAIEDVGGMALQGPHRREWCRFSRKEVLAIRRVRQNPCSPRRSARPTLQTNPLFRKDSCRARSRHGSSSLSRRAWGYSACFARREGCIHRCVACSKLGAICDLIGRCKLDACSAQRRCRSCDQPMAARRARFASSSAQLLLTVPWHY